MPYHPWCELPIVQAPTGSTAGAELCAAVCNAGGLGSIALTWKDDEAAKELIRKVMNLTHRTFIANFVLHVEPLCLSAALEAGAPMVTFSWGNPSRYVDEVRAAGAWLGVQVTSGAAAATMVELQPDFLIVQGNEAGGHVQAHWPLDRALEEVLEEAGSIPVFAAGGLGTGADLARVRSLGAVGGVFGTRFVASTESEAHPSYKARLVEAKPSDTVLTTCFDGGWPYAQHRVLRNSTFDRWEAAGCPASGSRPREGEWVASTASGEKVYRYDDQLPRVDTSGDWEAMALYAGTSVSGIVSIPSAAEIVQDIWTECQLRSS